MAGPVDTTALARWMRAFAALVAEHRDELTSLDAAIGDADHGTNMDRGMTAVLKALDADAPATPGALLKRTGMTLVSTVGGSSGPLYGTAFLRMATAGDDAGRMLRAALEGVIARGKAQVGDKTMIDAWLPALEALREGGDLGEALERSAAAAEDGMKATTPMEARKGRASYLGPRSVGHQDPGATSTYLLLRAAADTLG
jgi:dihydroxyacetone kinase-like protein